MKSVAIHKEDVMQSNKTADFQHFMAQKDYVAGSPQPLLLILSGFTK
jgi:hypothetical protein